MNIKNIQLKVVVRNGAILAIVIAISAMTVSDAFAQRGRGGGGGSRGGGGGARAGGGSYGGGASRAPSQSYNRSPSMSRPSTPSRPTSRPSTARPSTARPSTGAPANRGGATNRSAATGRAAQGANPSKSSLNSFINSPSQGAAGAGGRAAGGNAAVNDFFSHNSASATHNAAATHTNTATNRQAGSVANQRSENISGRTDTKSNNRDSRGENRDFASDNRQGRVSDRGDSQAVRVSDRGETRSSLAAGRGENQSQRQTQRSEHADHIRGELENEFDSNHLFDDFWKNNPEAYYKFNQNPAFWTWATAATVGTFFGAGYNTGGGGDTYYQDGAVYSDGGQPVPAEEYAEQAEEIVESAPEVENPDDMEWLPLGVFALSENSKSDATPNLFLQLAVSKEGIVAGTLNNKTTDETESVEGMLDQKSGRAAWTIVGKTTPIMETKIEDLTENETNMLVHFEDGTTQEWLMLHMEKPADDK